MPCHIKSLAVPQITAVLYLAFAYDFLPPQINVPFSTPNFNLAFNSWLRRYFFQEVFLLKDWAKHLPHTAQTMLTQTPESKIKPITKVTERGRDFLQVRTFLKAFPPQLILKGWSLILKGVRKSLFASYHHIPASSYCCNGSSTHESPRQGDELLVGSRHTFCSLFCTQHRIQFQAPTRYLHICSIKISTSLLTTGSMFFNCVMISFPLFFLFYFKL